MHRSINVCDEKMWTKVCVSIKRLHWSHRLIPTYFYHLFSVWFFRLAHSLPTHSHSVCVQPWQVSSRGLWVCVCVCDWVSPLIDYRCTSGLVGFSRQWKWAWAPPRKQDMPNTNSSQLTHTHKNTPTPGETMKRISHSRTHTHVQLDTPHTCWVFRESRAPLCLHLEMKGGEEERRGGERGGGKQGGAGQRKGEQIKRKRRSEYEEWQPTLPPLLLSCVLISFVSRWVEVSDSNESQNRKGGEKSP